MTWGEQFMKRSFFFILLLLLLPQPAAANDTDFLSQSERTWLADHPVITIGVNPNSAPYEFFDEKGKFTGISAEYLALLAKKLNITLKIVAAPNWAGLLTMAQEKKIDIVPAIVPSANRSRFLAFSDSWLSVPGVVLSGNHCRSMEDLKEKKVAVVDNGIWDDYLSRHPVNIKLVRVEDTRTAIELTAMSGVYAMVSDLATVTEQIRRLGVTNLQVVYRLDKKLDISFGVRRDWPELVSILNKTMAALDPGVREKIISRWLTVEEIPWWRSSFVHRIGLIILGGFAVLVLLLGAWNQILRRQVKKRSLALEQAQHRLVHAAKMESIGQLAAGVAHEVKNPLAIISMGVEYLAGAPDRDATEQEVLADMDTAVLRAEKIIRSLLDFSRNRDLDLQAGDISEVINQSLHLVKHEINKRNIDVHVDFAPIPPVQFDYSRIQQVLINLFMNSVQAMEDGGRLEVIARTHRLGRAEVGLNQDFVLGQEVAKIIVKDSGPGIAPKDSDKIFDLFYTTKEVGQGTGLGLSESRKIIDLHHGSLLLTNREDKQQGACATILLPFTRGEE
jgi:signal transduction histidine kinase